MDLELSILSALVYDEVYTRKVLPFLKAEYFSENSSKHIFEIINNHFSAYNISPIIDAIAIEAVSIKGITQPLAKSIETTLNTLTKQNYQLDWLLDKTESWCKERAVYNSLVECIEIQDGTNKLKSIDAIPDILAKALSVGFDTNIGVDYIDTAEERYDAYNNVEKDKIPLGLKYLDLITKGGFSKKTLNLVAAVSAVGKMEPISEPVLTPNGWSTMGQLRPGDYVIGSSGLPIKVLSIHPQGVQDVYTVKTMDGVDIRCGKDHLWSVWVNGHRRQVLVTKTTQELIDGGIRRSSGCPRYTLPKFDGLQEGKSVNFGYALGYCLGNACFSSGQLMVSYDDRIESKLLPLLEPSLGIPSTSRVSGGTHNGRSLYSWSNIHPEIAKYRNSGLSHDKHLHKDHANWLLWDYNSRLELLQGLLDSDGTVGLDNKRNRQSSSFCSTSINLLILVRDLVRSLGGRACEIRYDNRTRYKSGHCGIVSFRMPVCPFKLRADKWKLGEYSMQSSISDITKNDYQEEQVCITVDAEDCLYVTTGFKLTHNSIFLCHHAAQSLSVGKNVLFITLEMSSEAIAQRIDANMLDVPMDELYTAGKSTYLTKFKKLQYKTHGKLYIKEYPMSTAHVGHFKSLLDELRVKKEFIPDIIFVDYLNICASYTNVTNSSGYERVKQIAEQLRGLAQKNNIPILSAIQLNRGGVGNNDPDMSNIADSYSIAMTADFIMALVSNESLAELGQILCIQIKNRYSSLDKYGKFVLGLDKSRMKFYDVEQTSYSGDTEDTQTPVSIRAKGRKELSSFLTD